ncbi:FAD-binding and (Fe-S)-binding domain-containing protein [Helicobacter sp. 11S02596-1]|uniref:FAD-binding and (Fe-S)-binding domain-containing protein n=1 Tax=Helicobacter sp. 11S02596-1 TaxID=1476194 RepID=UPI000BA70B0D|nr:FAD-binding and (Fe-S)-binding domain-containing protein [Helicobacter sp. 11S02596-1]PAF44260.1 lactate dehydrogenase [Helicobacter sp. 11S02596-1]
MMQDYESFKRAAIEFLGDRIYDDYLRRFVYGTDASCYRYIPELVIKAHSEDEIIKIYALAQKYNIPLTFRAAGSSLSGQACSDSVLVIASHCWENISISENADFIRLSCGVIGAKANDALKPYGKKIGPDPATLTTAMIGGILSNNSSGMCCGVKQNSYNTLASLRVILSDGTLLDTADKQNIKQFLTTHTHITDALLNLREEILADEELTSLIKKKYKIKNTTGYSLNALVDFSDPIDILSHLFIGSEGTLGFISACEYECVPDLPYKTCALLFYENMSIAAEVIKILASLDSIIAAAEVMDYASLKSVQNAKGVPTIIQEIQPNNACILIQAESTHQDILQNNLDTITQAIAHIPTILPIQKSSDEAVYASWWKIRKGLLPIAASTRRKGSCVITEDVCFAIDDFGAGVGMIQALFEKYGFKDNSIIFGHALSGNIHFIITPILDDSSERKNFENLIEEMAKNVAGFGGSIKAEHGTGRMVAPFVEIEWGKKAYEINKKIKQLFDPKNLLNPDVIISNDPQIHTKNLKTATQIEDELDTCMECGFCEKICPSKNLTLTPRQRIALHREIKRLQNNALAGNADDMALLKELQKGYAYFSDATCAVCNMCATLCPLEIPTGAIAADSRKQNATRKKQIIAKEILAHLQGVSALAKFGLEASAITAKLIGEKNLQNLSGKITKFAPSLPQIPKNLPQKNTHTLSDKPAQKQNLQALRVSKNSGVVIYFSTCINRTFAPSKHMPDQRSIQEVFESLCAKANISVRYPKKIHSMCCGKAFVDYEKLSKENANKNYALLKELSLNGEIPIVLDHTACSTHLIEKLKNTQLQIYDLGVYIDRFLLPVLQIEPISENIGLYTMCAGKKAGQENIMLSLAKHCTKGEIFIHKDTGCCGFAGNKGFFTPELNASALEDFSKFYSDKNVKKGFGSSSTCEIGLSDKTGFPWQHIAYLIDACTTAKDVL